MNEDHLNEFQIDCERRVLNALGALDAPVVDREVLEMRSPTGESAWTLCGTIDGTEVKCWIYEDGASVGEQTFEDQGFPSLNELRDYFIGETILAVAKARMAAPKEVTNKLWRAPWWKP